MQRVREGHTVELPIDRNDVLEIMAANSPYKVDQMLQPLVLIDGKPLPEGTTVHFAVSIDHSPGGITEKRSRLSQGPSNPLGLRELKPGEQVPSSSVGLPIMPAGAPTAIIGQLQELDQ